ncbi:sulfite reductase [Candidatus Neptunochlamydia vexilliferae]|uniref:sulfite reductase n=1 Tax=Candidatus Neptunichlamydia vexilliferae TaxID=1651774 RepID=UPI0018918D19|nr:sulfite reductase [Candidatus Neptunochlamydia vexilliferae]
MEEVLYNKENPFPAKIVERYLLNKEGSTKKTYHVTLDLADSGMTYKAGDAIAIYPENSPEDVATLLAALGKTGVEEVIDPRSGKTLSLEHFLKTKVNLLRIDEGVSLEDLLVKYPPLLPRFYSIASSPQVSPNRVDLLVATFTYKVGDIERKGLGSHFLCDLAEVEKTPIYTYLHPTAHFTLPDDPNVPIIMVGPGTGVAPYRAFLQEREAQGATGKNWLLFGERHRAHDYYYESYLEELKEKKFLHLDLAFSRDQEEKTYVQHHLLKRGVMVWKALQEGAHFYVCGDARRMAKDVTHALQTIIETHGALSPANAKNFIKTLRKEKRFLLDVY